MKDYRTRYDYQQEYCAFDIAENDKILDIGSGNNPFPHATHLADLYTEDDFHRGGEKIVTDDRAFYKVDIGALPFEDKEFDFVYCSHVLEHVDDPKKACSEIMRVGKRGYIETPTRLSDMMYNFSYLHKWYVNMAGNTLVFIEYSEREKRGTNTELFFQQRMDVYDNPFRNMLFDNMDIFCNMFFWDNVFECIVIDKYGKFI